MENKQKKSLFGAKLKTKLETMKTVAQSEQFKKASKELLKSVKNLNDTMDVFK